MTIHLVPTFEQLSHIFLDEKKCFDFLVTEQILELQKECRCGRTLYYSEAQKGFRCSLRECRKSFYIFSGTLFAKAILPINKIMHLAYLWLCKCTTTTVLIYTGHSPNTVCSYFKYFRQLVGDSLDELDYCIGGICVEVELDESKFGKRKYDRGHAVEGVWVLGGVE